jgi:magnesium transporter
MARFLKHESKKIGTAPGALIFTGTKKAEEVSIDAITYNADFVEEHPNLSPEDAHKLVGQNHITWINVFGLHDTGVISGFGELFGFHPLLQEDLLNIEQRPKFDPFDDHLAFILKMVLPREEGYDIEIEQLSFVVGSGYIISFQEVIGDVFNPIRERLLRPTTKIRTRGSDYLAFALMDAVVDNYIVAIEQVGNQIEMLEDEIHESFSKEQLKQIIAYKKEINNLRRIIRPVIEMAAQFEKSDAPFISPKTIPFIKDLEDHVLQATEAIEIYKELLNDELTAYHNSLSNRLNDIMRVLTVFSVVFIPLTFIAGVYGANFEHMPELGYKYAYPIFWLILISVASYMLYYFRRKGWL